MIITARTKKSLSTAVMIIAAIIGIFVALAMGLIMALESERFRLFASHKISDATGREVRLGGAIDFDWGRITHVRINDVSMSNPDWAQEKQMLYIKHGEVAIKLLPLLKGDWVLPEVILESPVLNLERAKDERANWQFGDNPLGASALELPAPDKRTDLAYIDRLIVRDGKLHVIDATRDIDVTFEVAVAQGAAEKRKALQLSGKGTYQKQPFHLALTGASAVMLQENNVPYPFSLEVAFGPTIVKARGTVDDPFAMQEANLTLDLQGKNVADLFPLTGIALPPSPSYQVKGDLDYNGTVWRFTHFDGHMGKSDIKGDVTWDTSITPPYFKANFISEFLDMKDLGGFIGAREDTPKKDDRVLPDQQLDITRLKAMNADIVFRGRKIQSTQVLDNFHMNVALKDGVLTFHPLSFGVARGTIAAEMVIDGKSTPPLTTADVTFSRLSLAKFFKPLADKYGEENVSSGLMGGRAKLQGSGGSLRDILATANGDMGIGMEGGHLSRLLLEVMGLDIFKATGLVLGGDKPVAINCMVGDFKMEKGIMQTREFLIDTDVSNIRGQGAVNLKNEVLDMKLTVHPKDASPLSIRAPLLITGTLGKPSVMPDPAVLAVKGGAAVVLGALLTPLASMLAFIEPGLGKDSNCVVFLERLDKKTGGHMPPATAQK